MSGSDAPDPISFHQFIDSALEQAAEATFPARPEEEQ